MGDPQTTLSENGQKIANAATPWSFSCPTGLDGHNPVMSPPAEPGEVEESSGCTAWHEVIRDIAAAFDTAGSAESTLPGERTP
jgi:hypothetical protein